MTAQMLYSQTSGGFHLSTDRDKPDDAKPITAKRHQTLLDRQENIGEIVPNAMGDPVNRRRTLAQLRALMQSRVQIEAANRIEAISPLWQQLNDSRLPSIAGALRFTQIDAVRDASNSIEVLISSMTAAQINQFDIPNSTLWPEFT